MQKQVANVEFLRRRSSVALAKILGEDRIIKRNGLRNIVERNIPNKTLLYLKDFVEVMIEGQWRHTILVFVTAYFCCWTVFAGLYYLIGWAHGDLLFDENGKRLGEGKEPCILDAKSFTGFMLMSVETQVTTGYGEKYPSEDCPEAVFLMILQLCVGVVIDGTMIGIFYSKMIRPPKYADMMFSKKAVICLRDGKLCLIFRMWDFRNAHDIKTRVRAYLFEEKTTKEGEHLGKIQSRLKMENRGRVFLFWPVTLCHIIDSKSPLYDMTAHDLVTRKMEVILTLTGISHKTGQIRQARTSYLTREILWGHRFVNVIKYNYQLEKYEVDENLLDVVEEVSIPLCSARMMEDMKQDLKLLKILEDKQRNQCFRGEILYEDIEQECEHEPTCSKYLDLDKTDKKLRSSESLHLSAETV